MVYLCPPQGAVVHQMVTKEEEREVSQDAPRVRREMDVIWWSNRSQMGSFSHAS